MVLQLGEYQPCDAESESDMTPAVNIVHQSGITHALHEYAHDPSRKSYGLEAAQQLGVLEERVFKTLVVKLDATELVVAIIPVARTLSMKLMARVAGAKKAVMAAKAEVERSTGYVLGGVSPLGQRKRLRTFIHASAKQHGTVFVSGGRRGLEIELHAADLGRLTDGVFAELVALNAA
jgi:Cys-tRNA(Pro)/Cys-tRNA(Cys) deacylase